MEPVRDFPLFPLDMVALPTEAVPLHIFEERFKTMIERCLERGDEFGIVWMAEDGLHDVGCACVVEEVLERMPDGEMNIAARGTRPFRILGREEGLPYPSARVEFLDDTGEAADPDAVAVTHTAFAELVEAATDREPEPDEIMGMSSYEIAGTIEFAPESKQTLLELRSENARLKLLGRLLRAALKRIELLDTTRERARSNGHIRIIP